MPESSSQNGLRLEPQWREPYLRHRSERSPASAGALLKAVSPVIDLGVRTYGAGGDSPVLRSRARRIALDAVDSYDPTRASLKTHLMSHLRGLQRVAGAGRQVLSVPEQVALDRNHLSAMEAGFRDEHGRDPSDQELSDRSSLSVRRIGHVRSYRPPVAEGQLASLTPASGEGDGPLEPAVARADPTRRLAEFLYPDLDGPDQLILEHTLGLNGAPRLQARDIARRLNLTPSAVSQRARRVQERLDALADTNLL